MNLKIWFKLIDERIKAQELFLGIFFKKKRRRKKPDLNGGLPNTLEF